jgi:hypothetical protein
METLARLEQIVFRVTFVDRFKKKSDAPMEFVSAHSACYTAFIAMKARERITLPSCFASARMDTISIDIHKERRKTHASTSS